MSIETNQGGQPATEIVAGREGARVVLSVGGEDYAADVAELPSGRFLVAWTDGVANEWSQEVPDMGLAYCWLALLERCAESGWVRAIDPFPNMIQAAFRSLLDDATAGEGR